MIKPVSKTDILPATRTTIPVPGAVSQPHVDAFAHADATHTFKPAKIADYVWHPSWAFRTATAPTIPHSHGGGGGNVPIDLDEAANAAAVSANRVGLGIWFKMPILLVGIKYAWDGAVEAFETLTHWRGDRIEHDEQIQHTSAVGSVARSDDDIYRHSRQKNAAALTQMQRTAKTDGDKSFALAMPTLVGCVGMGGSLVCMADLLGGLIPAVEPMAELLMHVAVPAMCLFAAGMFVISGIDQVDVIKRYFAVNKAEKRHATSGKNFETLKSGVSQIKRELFKRTISNVSNATLAASMGLGVWMLGAGALTGLWFMLPGALGLALAQYLRAVHVGHGNPFADAEDTVELGGKRMICEEIDHLDAQLAALTSAQLNAKGKTPSAKFKQLHVQQSDVQRTFLSRQIALINKKGSRSDVVDARLDALKTRALRVDIMRNWLGDADAPYRASSAAVQTILQTLDANGLLRQLVLELGRDARFDAALPRERRDGKLIIANEDVYAIGDRAPEKFEAFCEVALKIAVNHGAPALTAQKRALLDLLRLRLDAPTHAKAA